MLEHAVFLKLNKFVKYFSVDTFVDSGLVARVRGLQWQVNDNDVARFFVGLNIAPYVVACFIVNCVS